MDRISGNDTGWPMMNILSSSRTAKYFMLFLFNAGITYLCVSNFFNITYGVGSKIFWLKLLVVLATIIVYGYYIQANNIHKFLFCVVSPILLPILIFILSFFSSSVDLWLTYYSSKSSYASPVDIHLAENVIGVKCVGSNGYLYYSSCFVVLAGGASYSFPEDFLINLVLYKGAKGVVMISSSVDQSQVPMKSYIKNVLRPLSKQINSMVSSVNSWQQSRPKLES